MKRIQASSNAAADWQAASAIGRAALLVPCSFSERVLTGSPVAAVWGQAEPGWILSSGFRPVRTQALRIVWRTEPDGNLRRLSRTDLPTLIERFKNSWVLLLDLVDHHT